MDLETAIDILRTHNKWRRCNDDSVEQCNPTDVGKAIDIVVNHFDYIKKKNSRG